MCKKKSQIEISDYSGVVPSFNEVQNWNDFYKNLLIINAKKVDEVWSNL